MPFNFLPYKPDQPFLLPPSFHDWVAEDSVANFISDVVDLLEREGRLEALYERYRADGWGRAAYHPVMMLKVLLYSYCGGVFSSRRIAQDLERSVDLRYLSANQQPNFRTIADFRKQHLEALKGLFSTVLQLCNEAGLVKLRRVAVDGRIVKANASRDKNRKRKTIEREIKDLEAQVEKLLRRAEERDREEDKIYGEERRGDEMPQALRTRQDRLQRLKAARARIDERHEQIRTKQKAKVDARAEREKATGKKQRGRKTRDPDQLADEQTAKSVANPTDPDSILAKKRGTYEQAYNAQAVADCETQVIIAHEVNREHCDVSNLKPMVEKTTAQAGSPQVLLADAGYWSESNAELQTGSTELIINPRRDYKQRFRQAKEQAPRGPIPKGLTTRERMDRKLLTKRGRQLFAQRGQIEAVFGQMVGRGLRAFVLRGLAKVSAEWSLWCTTHNLLKLWRAGVTL